MRRRVVDIFVWAFNVFFAAIAVGIFVLGLAVAGSYVLYRVADARDRRRIEESLAEQKRTRFR